MMRELLQELKQTVVFLGETSEKMGTQFHATGFLLHVEGVFHLATAKHVVVDPDSGNLIDQNLIAFFNLKDGSIGSRSISQIKERFEVGWVFHERDEVDVALIPIGLDPERDDVKTIPSEISLAVDRLFETYDVFFLSYQPGLQSTRRITPVIRSGTIALIHDDETFYIDAAAFPGNSGSPVFLKPSPIRFDSAAITIGGDELGGKFVGIIGEYLPYQEVAISQQTGRPRIVFEENTGLSRVWSVKFLMDIVQSDAFKQQIEKITKK